MPEAVHIFTLPKKERIYLKEDISRLMREGRYGVLSQIKYSFVPGNGHPYNRIMVSVGKKFFKRAVRRNLLKRRIREAYRLNKHLLPPQGIDILFIYSSKEILSSESISELVVKALGEISERTSEKKEDRS